MAVIIVEGVKKVGKTTFALELSKKYNLYYHKIMHYIDNEDKNIDDYSYNKGILQAYTELIDQGYVNDIVIDRFHLSEYGFSAYRDYYPDYIYEIDNKLARNNLVKLIYLVDTIDNIKTRTDEKFISAYRLMDNLYYRTNISKISFNWSNLGWDVIDEFIKKG